MAEIQLSVAPESLRATATEIMDILRNVRSRAARIQNLSDRTRGYWRGDAGEEDRVGYRACGEELLNAARRLELRSVSLLKLSGLYQEMETKAEEVGASLNADSILSM